MQHDAGKTVSLWQATSHAPLYQPLRESLRTGVCVVGAGVAGLSVAWELARRGHDVVVIDDGGIGEGVTARTTAHLSNGLDDRYFRLARWHGSEGARMAAASHSAAIDFIERTVSANSIECDFERVPGYLAAATASDEATLAHECAAAREAGLDVALMEDPGIAARGLGPVLRFARQAQVHPLRYLYGVADAAVRSRVRIHTWTHASEIHGGSSAHVVCGDGSRVHASAVVVATNTPVNDRLALHTKQAAYRTFVIAVRVAADAFAPCLLWDTADPYHYARLWRDRDAQQTWLLVGGEDHRTGQPGDSNERFAALHRWMQERLGIDAAVDHAWSGQIEEPNDGLGFIGRNPTGEPNVFVVTGDSGNGLTHASLGALLIADLIEGRENPWETLYSPSRKTLRAAGAFVRENASTALQYRELLTGGEIDDVEAIAAGRGAIVRRGLHKWAAFRDSLGTLHVRSAICTHLGCVVSWNALEGTWDCGCHGSRFDAIDGHPVNGPANRPLAAAPDDALARS